VYQDQSSFTWHIWRATVLVDVM